MLHKHFLSAAVFAAILPSMASAQVELKYKYVPGRATKTISTTKMDQTLSIVGQTVDTKIESSEVTTVKEGEKTSEGLIPVVVHSDSTKTNGDFPGGLTLKYDSTKPEENKADPLIKFLEEALTRLNGMTLTIKVGEDGTVKTVEGAEKVLQDTDQLSPRAVDLIKSATNTETIKREFNEKIKRFEPGLVRKGDTWERTETSNGGGQPMKFKKKYEYQGTIQKDGKEYDKIDVKVLEASLEPDESANAEAKITKSDLKVVSSEGFVLFDRAAGADVESQSTIKLKGPITLNIAAANMELEGEIEFTIESTSKTTKAD